MGVARFTAILLAAVLCPLLALAESKEGKIKEGQEELFRSVLRHNAYARERIHSYVIEQEWTTYEPKSPGVGAPGGGPQGGLNGRHSMRLAQKREHLFISQFGRVEAVPGNWSQDQSVQVVLNDGYCAVYHRLAPLNAISVTNHESIRTMSESTKMLATSMYAKPSALDYLCGTGTESLMEVFQTSTAKATWSISDVELDGDAVYMLSMNRELSNGGKFGLNYYVDPKKDFLLCGWEQVLSGKKNPATLRIKLAHWGEGNGWFPKTIEHKGGAEYPDRKTITVVSVALNPVAFEQAFTIDDFEVVEGARMHRQIGEQAKRMEFIFEDGQWVEHSIDSSANIKQGE